MGRQAQQVERTDQVDLDRLGEGLERLRPVAPDDPFGRGDPGTGDGDAGRALRGGGIGHGLFQRGRLRHVGLKRLAADGACNFLRTFQIKIETGDFRPRIRQGLGRGGAQTRCRAGDQRRVTGNIHECPPSLGAPFGFLMID